VPQKPTSCYVGKSVRPPRGSSGPKGAAATGVGGGAFGLETCAVAQAEVNARTQARSRDAARTRAF